MVGAAVSLGLAQQGFSVVMLESREPVFDWQEDSFDIRVSAITRASQQIFDNLDAWSDMQTRSTAYDAMQVWDRAGFGEIHFSAAEIGEADLGHILENRVIVRSLWQQIDRYEEIQRLVPVEIVEQATGANGVVLTLSDGRCVEAAMLVGADGAFSQVRERAQIGLRSRAYDQSAVVATVRAELGNQATAWQRFMPAGPLALLPLNDDLFSVVWSVSPQQARQLLALEDQDFNAQLTAASEQRLGQLTLLGVRAAFPLVLRHASQYVQPGLALIGDAAHTIHPLAGQGVNLGLLDAAQLVDEMVDARARGQVPGSYAVLRRYERARKGHNQAVQSAMDGFKYLFSNDIAPVSLLRNVTLGVAGQLPPLRRLFERVALGQGLTLPRLAQRS